MSLYFNRLCCRTRSQYPGGSTPRLKPMKCLGSADYAVACRLSSLRVRVRTREYSGRLAENAGYPSKGLRFLHSQSYSVQASRPTQFFKKATVSFEVPGVGWKEETTPPGGTHAGVEHCSLMAIEDIPGYLGKTVRQMSPVCSFGMQTGVKGSKRRGRPPLSDIHPVGRGKVRESGASCLPHLPPPNS